MQENPQWWYFIFEVGHPQDGHYVRFFGTYDEARTAMIEKYGTKWKSQLPESEWYRREQVYKDIGVPWMIETKLSQ